jgi:hypothetical protein
MTRLDWAVVQIAVSAHVLGWVFALGWGCR